jgi:hypothetical protein
MLGGWYVRRHVQIDQVPPLRALLEVECVYSSEVVLGWRQCRLGEEASNETFQLSTVRVMLEADIGQKCCNPIVAEVVVQCSMHTKGTGRPVTFRTRSPSTVALSYRNVSTQLRFF